ncbi:hypothetical protein BDV36DRAFT_311637 [Aspergillus pseudocaelatus]|uniref:Uncharacterized protein n=1 Tax=Aspergillus pseudocaelatus TaxID=1825620 RepID=A0ABQ6WH34_9EURO|nr:hypothetical protein BDV36DRAFT_311637 [Aspergillus pseudocaelatus]
MARPSPIPPVRKRGRPRVYSSTAQKQISNIAQRRRKRQSIYTAKRSAEYYQYYTSTAAALPEPDPFVAIYFPPDKPTFPAELEPLLPPLSPPILPVNPISDNIPLIVSETVASSATPLPTVSVEIIVLCSTSPNHLDSPDLLDLYTNPEILPTVQALGQTLTDQLYTYHSCCHTDHSGLKDYLERVLTEGRFPDILRVPTMARREDHLARQISSERRQQVYCGISAEPSHTDSVHVCLATDHRSDTVTEVTFDIDSIVGFVSSLAVAKQGVRWNPTQMAVSDLQSSLHLDPLPVQYLDPQGRSYRALCAVHEIPHYTFGRLTGFEDISLILLFLRLYRKEQQSLVQHYPSSFEHSRLNGMARGVEPRMQRVESTARQQQLYYFLPPDMLPQIWANITILLQGKNLKILYPNNMIVTVTTGNGLVWFTSALPFQPSSVKETNLISSEQKLPC